MSARHPLSKSLRFEVFKRDGFVCQYCGSHPPAVILHVDHIIAIANGGNNEIDNLVTSCASCNLGKGARPINRVPETISQRAARTAEAEEQIAGYAAIFAAKRDRIEDDAWDVVHALTGNDTIRRDWLLSIKRFIEKLPTPDVIDAAEIARAHDPFHETVRFRYFCGVCWNKIRSGSR